jgi:eukaryotic-like serine/threonine-protein kinase
MTPERWRQITGVFHDALTRETAMREAFLDQACAHDPALRAEVEAMLAADQGAGRFGEEPALALARDEPRRFEPGEALGPYVIESLIGAGGMGEVYRAHDPRLERDVAIKVVSASTLGDPDARPRLLREARSAAALNHPHVCTIHEVGEIDGQAYIAMELIDGQPLDRAIPEGGLPVEQVVRYGLQIADAVAHAHDRGIVHRDLKTSNALITPQGRAKVLDFGLAKRLSGPELVEAATQASLTKPGFIAGTPAYMAPEQLRGQPADARSDVWALGVVLYEMVAGAKPFRGRTHFELSAAILNEPPAPLPAHVPPELRAVIERCLEKDLAGRYGEGGQVRAALEAIQRGGAPVSAARPSPSVRRRLAVLPLQDLSRDPDHEYFVEGTHDALITDLAGISALRVIARSSVMRYKGRETPLPEIASQLKVDIVLTGTVTRLGDQVRITMQLVDVSTEEHLWAGRYERGLPDVVSLQNEIVASIAHAISLPLTTEEHARLARGRPVNPEAYEAYLKGRFHCYHVSREHSDTALEYFQVALEKSPDYALAHAGIATTWLMRGDSGVVPAQEALPRLKAAVSKAIALDDTLAEVHEVAANTSFLYEWDWTAAEREFRRAIQLNPNYADAHLFYADFLATMKRVEEAKAEMGRALELDPLSSFFQCFLGWHAVYFRQHDDAIAQLRRVLKAEPSFSSAHLGLWGAFHRKGMAEEALDQARAFFAALGDTEVAGSLARGDGGDYDGAMRRAAATLAERGRRSYVPAIRIARLYAHASENERAFEWLERAYERHETPLIHLGVGWDWDGLRDDPRFTHLLRRIGLP